MNKKIISFLILFGLLGMVSFVSAQGVQLKNPLNGVDNFCQLLTSITTTVGGFVAALGTIMIIVAGILYLTSAGSPEKIGTAKKALIYAIVGITIGIAAGVIVDIIKNIINVAGTSC